MRKLHIGKTIICLCIVSVLLYIGLFMLIGVPFIESADAVALFTNDSVVANLTVPNQLPKVVDLVVDDIDSSPANEIDLTAGGVRIVNCTGVVVDNNGKDDIYACNASLFFMGIDPLANDDKNNHYSNSSCKEVANGLYNKTFTCTFTVEYFANNGTWYCNMSAWDTPESGISGYNSSTDTTVIQPLYAINLPPAADFGELALDEQSSADVRLNVTNIGNMDIDLDLYGYGGTAATPSENNLSMICTTGNISVDYMRWDLNSSNDAWDNMANLSGQFANPVSADFNLKQRESETLNQTNSTYWKIKIPSVGIKGQCNGTIIFNAAIDI